MPRKGAKASVDENSRIAQRSDPENQSDSILPPSETISAVSARLAMLDNGNYKQQTTLRQAVNAYMNSEF
nr:hypothetical protein [uncultured Gellertiella sp.]